MSKIAKWFLGAIILVILSGTLAQAGDWSIGIGIGGPPHRPPWGPYPRYYYPRPYPRPYPLFIEPAPVIVRPLTVYQPAPVVVQPVYPAPAAAPTFQAPMPSTQAVTRAPEERPADIDNHLQQLTNPDEKVRADVVIQLGRMRAERAVDPLAATLAGDASPAVRETAARALGLIGSTRALPALNRAAQADNDRDVRNSARFAVEVIQTGR